MNQRIIENIEITIKELDEGIKKILVLKPKLKIGYEKGRADGMLVVLEFFKRTMEEELTKWK